MAAGGAGSQADGSGSGSVATGCCGGGSVATGCGGGGSVATGCCGSGSVATGSCGGDSMASSDGGSAGSLHLTTKTVPSRRFMSSAMRSPSASRHSCGLASDIHAPPPRRHLHGFVPAARTSNAPASAETTHWTRDTWRKPSLRRDRPTSYVPVDGTSMVVWVDCRPSRRHMADLYGQS